MLYVAYGSNMNLEQMEYRCPNSKVACTGRIYGWKLVFDTHADIIPTGDLDNFVPVVAWNIADSDWPRLDMYEGFPIYYIKQEVEVQLDDGRVENCIVYVMAKKDHGYCPPFENYFYGIEKACQENGIDVQYLYDALEEAHALWKDQ